MTAPRLARRRAEFRISGGSPSNICWWRESLGRERHRCGEEGRAPLNSQLTAEEHRWTPVFVGCARSAVNLVERLQLSRRASFFSKHARQISEIKALAADLPAAGQ